MYCIYKHTSPTGKCYIGHATGNGKTRWGKDGKGYMPKGQKYTKFALAILLWGWDNLTHEIIEINIPTRQEAEEREAYWIEYYNSYSNGYNTALKSQHFHTIYTILDTYHLYVFIPKIKTQSLDDFPISCRYKKWNGYELDNAIESRFKNAVQHLKENNDISIEYLCWLQKYDNKEFIWQKGDIYGR